MMVGWVFVEIFLQVSDGVLFEAGTYLGVDGV